MPNLDDCIQNFHFHATLMLTSILTTNIKIDIEIWCWTSKLLSNNEKCTLQFANSPKQLYFTTSWSCLGFHGLCKIWEMAIHGENWSFLLKRLILTTQQNLSLFNKAANNSFRVLLSSQDIVHGIKLNQVINVAHE